MPLGKLTSAQRRLILAMDGRADVTKQPGNPIFLGLVVNNNSRGNHTWDLVFNRDVNNAGPAGDLDGFTVETSINGTSWFEIDKTNVTTSIVGNEIRCTNTGNSISISKLHRFRVTYAEASGDIQNTNFPADDLLDFGPTELTDNSSTINITRGQGTLAGTFGDHYGLTEDSGTREPVQNTTVSDYDMASVNSAGARTDPMGNANDALDLNNSAYLSSVDAWEQNRDRNSGGGWFILDTLPSVLGGGQNAYVWHKWSTNANRSWAVFISGRGAVENDDLIQIQIENEDNFAFVQKHTTALTTGVWRYFGWSHDSSGAYANGGCLSAFLQDYNTPASFTAIRNTVTDNGSSDRHMHDPGVPVQTNIGQVSLITQDKMDGGVSNVFTSQGFTFTEDEHRALAEYPKVWPYFIDLAA